MMKFDNAPVYRDYRIHISRLFSEAYVTMIVRLGGRDPQTTNSLTDTVTRVPGEYGDEEQAIHAARAYIDAAMKLGPK
jgi:hypothetical protein